MGYQWNSWVINLQTHAGKIVDTLQGEGMQSFLYDVKHFWVVDAVIVKHLLDGQPKGEGAGVGGCSTCSPV